MTYNEKKRKLWLDELNNLPDNTELFDISNIPDNFLEEKKWGWKFNLVSSFFWSIDVCWVVAGGYCSKHYHEMKANRFFVLSGNLEIAYFSDVKKIWTKKILGKNGQGRSQDIFPGVLHQFTAVTDCCFIEYENAKFEKNDIIRETEGGVL